MSATIEMAGVEKCVVIVDRGFFSNNNIKKLKSKHLSYIVPLKRNSSLIPEESEFSGVFMYDGRPVKFWYQSNGVFTFEDPVLRMEEEKDYLERVRDGKRSRRSFTSDSVNFGRIYLVYCY